MKCKKGSSAKHQINSISGNKRRIEESHDSKSFAVITLEGNGFDSYKIFVSI